MRIAILGATGLVGRAMLDCLEQRRFVDDDPLLLASERSAGTAMSFRGRDISVVDIDGADLAGADLALFSAGAAVSRHWAPRFVAAGISVVDNSSAWRQASDVALVVPEINFRTLPAETAIVANPNCSTIQIVMAVAPLHDVFGLRELHVATYQSVSGAGAAARRALLSQLDATRPADLDDSLGTPPDGEPFARSVAFDALPEIGAPLPDGSYEEEAKVVYETRRILDLPTLPVTCLAVRIPSWNGHGAAVRAVFERRAERDVALVALHEFPGLEVSDDPHAYRTPAQVSGCDAVHVGRLRRDEANDRALTFWVVADNLRKGAALNAVQIAEHLATRKVG